MDCLRNAGCAVDACTAKTEDYKRNSACIQRRKKSKPGWKLLDWVAQGCCGNAVFVDFQNLSGQCPEQHDLTLASKGIGPDDLQKSVPT